MAAKADMLDPHALWEAAQREVALEGSNGCALERLWHLLGLLSASPPSGSTTHQASTESAGGDGGASASAAERDDSCDVLIGWLWRTLIARRGKEIEIVIFDNRGESTPLKRGEEEDVRLAGIQDIQQLKDEHRFGVVASQALRLRVMGLDTAGLNSMKIVSPSYLQVLEVVGRFRERGADIDDVLTHINALNVSSKKDDYNDLVNTPKITAVDARTSGGMTASHLYPVYDRLNKEGLLFKSIVQKPHFGEDEEDDTLGRFTMLYLTRFKDHIRLEDGCRLEPTAKEVFLDMIVSHLSEVAGGPGTVVPWHNVRRQLFPIKKVAGRVKNFLQKETTKPEFPIKMQMLDVRTMDYNPDRRNRRLEPCVSLKPSAELESATRVPVGLSIFRAMAGIIKSRGEQGATIDYLRNKLGFATRAGQRISQLMVDQPRVYGVWKGFNRVGRCGRVQTFYYDPDLLGTDYTNHPRYTAGEAKGISSTTTTAAATTTATTITADRNAHDNNTGSRNRRSDGSLRDRNEGQSGVDRAVDSANLPNAATKPSPATTAPTATSVNPAQPSFQPHGTSEAHPGGTIDIASAKSVKSGVAQTSAEALPPTSIAVTAASASDSSAAGVSSGGGGDGGGGGPVEQGSGLAELNWENDAELDALMDVVDMEIGEQNAAEVEVPETMIQERIKWELNPYFPPQDAPPEMLEQWRLMVPADRRKMLMLHELDKYTAVTTEVNSSIHLGCLLSRCHIKARLGQKIKQMEGPGPTMHKHTLTNLISTLVKEEKAKLVPVPMPSGPPIKAFAGGDMLVHRHAPTDLASTRFYSERFYKLEREISNRISQMKGQDFRGGKYKWDVARSINRFLVHKRRMHRTMILHRELLRCLPQVVGQKGGSRALNLDRVLLDTPLSVFLTMFGYPPSYLHSEEMHRVLRSAENKRCTVRNSPRAIWEMIGNVPWYREALISALEALHDMKIITKVDSPTKDDDSATLAYSHESVKEAPSRDRQVSPRRAQDPASNTGNIRAFEAALAESKAAQHRLTAADDVASEPISIRGRRRDKKARGAAAAALLNVTDPPKEISCYQFYGTGKRDSLVGERAGKEAGQQPLKQGAAGEEASDVAHPLASWLLKKVPELENSDEWDVDQVEKTKEQKENAWHKMKRQWTHEEDRMLIEAAVNFRPHAPACHPGGQDTRRRHLDVNPELRVAFRPVADALGKSVMACWRRYKLIAKAQSRNPQPDFIAHPVSTKISARGTKRSLASNETRNDGDGKRESARGSTSWRDKRRKRSRRTGVLADDGPLVLVNPDEERSQAREQAALAKAAGFEWVNEEGSWVEDGRKGGIQPRDWSAWEWSMDEVAALTAVRQVLLVPEDQFDAVKTLERLRVFRPPLLQKAYRVLLSLKQVNILQRAWTANEFIVQDCVDHEVYKMSGRHGAAMVTRGIAAVDALQDYGLPLSWAPPKIALKRQRQRHLQWSSSFPREETGTIPLPRAEGPTSFSGTDSGGIAHGCASRDDLGDIGADGGVVGAALEAVATGEAAFWVEPHDSSVLEGNVGVASADNVHQVSGIQKRCAAEVGGCSSRGDLDDLSAHANVGDVPSSTSTSPDNEISSRKYQGSSEEREQRGLKGCGAGRGSMIDSQQANAPVCFKVSGGWEKSNEQERGTAVDRSSVPATGVELPFAVDHRLEQPVSAAHSTKFRIARMIDEDIMGTVTAEIRPLTSILTQDAGGFNRSPGWSEVDARMTSVAASAEGVDDANLVVGPEVDWRRNVKTASAESVLGLLREAGTAGLSLPVLRQALRSGGDEGAGSQAESDEVLLSALGAALRSGEVVCVCGAADVIYIERSNANLWIVSTSDNVQRQSVASGTPSPAHPSTPSEIGGQPLLCVSQSKLMRPNNEDSREAPLGGSGVASGSGGKRIAEPASAKILAAPAKRQDGVPKVWMPWVTLEGNVNGSFLIRIRQGVIAYVKKHSGCRADDVRTAECPFLSTGEVLLVLRDLVRRKILTESAVPDTRELTLENAWGVSCTKLGIWANRVSSERGHPKSPREEYVQDVWVPNTKGSAVPRIGTAASASFRLALGWSDLLARLQNMRPSPGATAFGDDLRSGAGNCGAVDALSQDCDPDKRFGSSANFTADKRLKSAGDVAYNFIVEPRNVGEEQTGKRACI